MLSADDADRHTLTPAGHHAIHVGEPGWCRGSMSEWGAGTDHAPSGAQGVRSNAFTLRASHFSLMAPKEK